VIVEAAAAGLPVICSQDCGAGVELVRDYHTGFVIPTDDIDACRRALERMHHSHDHLAAMGREIRHAAAAYSAERWADNQIGLCERLLHRPV
jgi:glycosyltransferase involved in cell wall biosynthesis